MVRGPRRRHHRLASARDKGHGYDPIFQPIGGTETFAEMDQDEKNRISHRADAFGQLVKAVF